MNTSTKLLTRRNFISGLVLGGWALGMNKLAFADEVQLPLIPRRYMRGCTIPFGLSARIKAQTRASRALDQTLKADADVMKAIASTNPRVLAPPQNVPSRFDWRDSKRVTAVKNQGQCGSCWVFAAIGAYESAYLIANNQEADQVTVDVSEQEALDCSYGDSNCQAGGFHEIVFFYLQNYGEIESYRYPYKESKLPCATNFQRIYYALNWSYVSLDGAINNPMIPLDAALKQAIYQYGPVASTVNTDGWDSYSKTDVRGQPIDWSKTFPNSIFPGKPSSTFKPNDVDHEVVIVGWDDARGAPGQGVWIIKNSWDTTWGDDGYIYLPYGTANIGYGAAWVTVGPNSSVSSSLASKLRLANQNSPLRQYYTNMPRPSLPRI